MTNLANAGLPRDSCDTHFHIFGDPNLYPVRHGALYRPPEGCDVSALRSLHAEMGIDRGVIVQAMIYGTDNRLMCEALRLLPAGAYRGVAIIDDSVSDTELEQMHTAGVRCARFNFASRFRLAPSPESFRRSLDRIGALGWSAKIFAFGDDLLAIADELRRIRIPAIVDHLGGVDFRGGTEQPAVQLIVELLHRENWWIGLSNGDLWSAAGPPWDDAVPFGQLFHAVAPTRCLWGTDWPHVHRFVKPGKDEQSDYGLQHEMQRIASLLARYVPDQAARDRVLVGNPARLFGFDDHRTAADHQSQPAQSTMNL